jgi:ketosteroid isomerase-like protein
MMPTPDPVAFGNEWMRAWNAHDVEAVLAHFHDDVVFSSPVAARLLPETGGAWQGLRRVQAGEGGFRVVQVE